MRENIGLFKAKDINTKEWVEGYYWSNELGNHFIRVVKDKDGDFINPFEYEIDPETICEYTGLLDNHGNKIWENDIVQNKGGDVFSGKYNFITQYENGRFIFKEDFVGIECDWRQLEYLEITGNRFDNEN